MSHSIVPLFCFSPISVLLLIKESVFAFFNFSMHFLSLSHLKVESLWQALGMTVPGLEREKDHILEVLSWLATQWA